MAKDGTHAPDALRVRLLERLRPVGFQHCDVIVDEALETESEDGEDAAEGTAADPTHGNVPEPEGSATAPVHGAGGILPGRADAPSESGAGADPAAAQPAAGADVGSAGADGGAAGAPAADAAGTRLRLTILARRATLALAAGPSGADAIRTAAAQARGALASGDAAAVGRAADALERLLPPERARDAPAPPVTRTAENASGVDAGSAPAAGSAAPGQATPSGADGRTASPANTQHPPGSPVFAKGQAAWTAVRTKLQADIDTAMKAMVASYGEDDSRVRAILDRVEPIMKQLDDSLAVKLGEVAGNGAPDAHGGLVREAEQIIARYRAFVDGEPMIGGLDGNPFHPMSVRRTMDTALAALSKVVETAS